MTQRLGGGGLLVGLVLGILLALIGTRILGGRPQTADESTPAQITSAQTVTTASVGVAPIRETLTVTGTVAAVDLLEVTPQLSGLQIRQVRVREGDAVEAGQVLAVLDDATLRAQIRQAEAEVNAAQARVQQQQAALAQAQASLAEAQQNRDRYRALASQGAVSQEELTSRETQALTAREAIGVAQANVQSAEASVRSQQADLERLQTQLGQTTVRAPAAGIVAERFATVGDVSSAADPVFTLIQNNQLELDAEVPQTQLEQIEIGAPVRITSTSDSRLQLQGTVRDISPLVDTDTRTGIVNIGLPASDLLRPGMFLQGAIVTGSRQGLVVPASALLPQQDGRSTVYVLGPDNQVAARPVETGTRLPAEPGGAARVEIISGLQPGEQVVTTGTGYLQDGDTVTVVEEPS